MKNRVYLGDNLNFLKELERSSVQLIYIKPPAIKDNSVDEYLAYLEPRIVQAFEILSNEGTIYFHSKQDIVHYCKVQLLDQIFINENGFLNEIIWTYDTEEEQADRWLAKHDSILVYAKKPGRHIFNADDIDRISYLAPKLVGEEKAKRGKLPTDTWWHTNLEENGQEKNSGLGKLPYQIIKRIILASSNPDNTVLDLFARDGIIGEACFELNRRFILIDKSRRAMKAIAKRLRDHNSIEWTNYDPSNS